MTTRSHSTDEPAREFVRYIRVSDEAGRSGDSFHSPDHQREQITRAVEYAGGVVACEQADLSVTGRTMDRPGLQAAIEWVFEDPGRRGVATLNVSRLGRSLRGVVDLCDELREAGAEIIAVEQRLDTTTAHGRGYLRDLANQAQTYSEIVGENWSAVHARRRRNGLRHGGSAPYGFRNLAPITDPETGETLKRSGLEPHPDQAPVLAKMYRDFVAGKGIHAISQDLNRRKVPTQRGAKAWTMATVRGTLDSGAAAGVIAVGVFEQRPAFNRQRQPILGPDGKQLRRRTRVGWEYVPGAHKPIISARTWREYQAEKQRRATLPARRRVPSWELAEIARCGLCGAPSNVLNGRSAQAQVVCSAYRQGKGCPGTFISRSILRASFAMWCYGQLQALADAAEGGLIESQESRRVELREQIAGDRKQLAKLAASRTRLARLVGLGDVSEADFREVSAENRDETARLEQQIDQAQRELDARGSTGDALAVFERATRPIKGDPHKWNALLRRAVEAVEIHPEYVLFRPRVGQPSKQPRTRRRVRSEDKILADFER